MPLQPGDKAPTFAQHAAVTGTYANADPATGRTTMTLTLSDGAHTYVLYPSRNSEFIMLETDAISATGMPDGIYSLGGLEVQVSNGRCEYQGKLAGSVLTLDRAIRNVMSFAGWQLQQAVRLATLNPAQRLGISDQRGLLALGRRADLAVLTPEGQVAHTIIGGEMVN